jgi:hypothetical protein
MSTSDSQAAQGGSPAVVVRASDYWTASDSIVDGATKVAEAAVQALRSASTIVISVRFVRGISSCFGNVVLLRVQEEYGPTAIIERLSFDTDSEAQRQVIQRSLEAVRQPN